MEEALLERLCCPVTHQPLVVADADTVRDANERIARGILKNASGNAVDQPLEGGLLREDRAVLYPIRHGIPVLLPEEGISL